MNFIDTMRWDFRTIVWRVSEDILKDDGLKNVFMLCCDILLDLGRMSDDVLTKMGRTSYWANFRFQRCEQKLLWSGMTTGRTLDDVVMNSGLIRATFLFLRVVTICVTNWGLRFNVVLMIVVWCCDELATKCRWRVDEVVTIYVDDICYKFERNSNEAHRILKRHYVVHSINCLWEVGGNP